MPGVRILRSFAPEELKQLAFPGGDMTGVDKFIRKVGLMPSPSKNLWEVLEQDTVDTYPIHTALWLFKRARGYRGLFTHFVIQGT